ncbi:MAG: hypothetical protein ACI8PZ_002459 [Myxococcota bacterium]|jgi:hypothetical protein
MSPFHTLVDHNVSVHRAIATLFRTVRARAAEGIAPHILQEGVRAAVTVLRGHHAYEEEVLLPELRSRGASGPWDRVSDEHATVAAHLDALVSGDPLPHLDALCALLPEHFAIEDEALTEEFWRGLFTEDEARAFGQRVSRHNRDSLKPSAKLLPLLLYNLAPDERGRFTDRMPRFLIEGLVPVAFRPAWRGLRPFMAHPPARWTPAAFLRGRR